MLYYLSPSISDYGFTQTHRIWEHVAHNYQSSYTRDQQSQKSTDAEEWYGWSTFNAGKVGCSVNITVQSPHRRAGSINHTINASIKANGTIGYWTNRDIFRWASQERDAERVWSLTVAENGIWCTGVLKGSWDGGAVVDYGRIDWGYSLCSIWSRRKSCACAEDSLGRGGSMVIESDR